MRSLCCLAQIRPMDVPVVGNFLQCQLHLFICWILLDRPSFSILVVLDACAVEYTTMDVDILSLEEAVTARFSR